MGRSRPVVSGVLVSLDPAYGARLQVDTQGVPSMGFRPIGLCGECVDAIVPEGERRERLLLIDTRDGRSGNADGIIALFTCNGAIGEYPDYTGGGGVYAYRLGGTQATLAFDPPAGMHNYSMGSIAYGLGRFYYVNDSGRLFALAISPAESGEGGHAPGERQESDSVQDDEAMLYSASPSSTIALSAPTDPAISEQAVYENETPLAAAGSTMQDAVKYQGLMAYVFLFLSLGGVAVSIALFISGTRKQS